MIGNSTRNPHCLAHVSRIGGTAVHIPEYKSTTHAELETDASTRNTFTNLVSIPPENCPPN